MAEFLSQAWPYAAAVLVILGAVALVALIVVLVRVAKSMKHVNTITAEAEKEVTPALKRVDPLVDRAELTVDTLNLELLRVDAILEDVENVTDMAGKTADTVNALTTAPSNAVASIAEHVQAALGSKRKQKARAERFVYPIGAGKEGAHSAQPHTEGETAAADVPQGPPAAAGDAPAPEPVGDAPSQEPAAGAGE